MVSRLGLALAALVLAAPAAAAAPPFQATLDTSTHTPRVNAEWRYTVHVTDLRGRTIPATITAQIIDPFGGVHPVEFDCCKRNIVDYAMLGFFTDQAEFPRSSRGFRLTFRVTVKARGAVRVLTYWIKSV